MKVIVLTSGEYSNYSIEGVFTMPEKALLWVQGENKNKKAKLEEPGRGEILVWNDFQKRWEHEYHLEPFDVDPVIDA